MPLIWEALEAVEIRAIVCEIVSRKKAARLVARSL